MIPTIVGLRKKKNFNLMNWLSYFFYFSNAVFRSKISEFKIEIQNSMTFRAAKVTKLR